MVEELKNNLKMSRKSLRAELNGKLKTLDKRIDTVYDLTLSSLAELPRFLIYVIKRILGKENKRIENSVKFCNLQLQKSLKVKVRETFDFEIVKEANPIELALKCKEKLGFYPISFVDMRELRTEVLIQEKTKSFSSIIPGTLYSYDSEVDYYKEYQSSEFAFTFKKCGWDSYRSIEIVSQGTIPIYLEIEKVPRFCMTFYPKLNMQILTENYLQRPYILSSEAKFNFLELAWSRLNTKFLGKYLLELVGAEPKNVLFFDEHLDIFKGDYQSMMVLKAFSDITDLDVTTPQKLEYLFDSNYQGQDLYGRGFGYKGILKNSKVKNRKREIDYKDFDLVIVGSAARNWNFISKLEDKMRNRVVLIWGEDHAPTKSELAILNRKSSHVFIREISHPFIIP